MSAFDKLMHSIVARLPLGLHHWTCAHFPRWALPPSLIIKCEGRHTRTVFEQEARMYEIMKPIQGSVVPVLFGQASFQAGAMLPSTDAHGTPLRALLLSDVGGLPFSSPKLPRFTYEELAPRLEHALQAMHRLGLGHDDIRLDNYHLVGDRIVILDHEFTHTSDPDWAEGEVERSMGMFWQQYSTFLQLLRMYGEENVDKFFQ